MVTLTLVAADGGDDIDRTDAVLRTADMLATQHPEAAWTVAIIVENYIDCLQSLVDDYETLGGAS